MLFEEQFDAMYQKWHKIRPETAPFVRPHLDSAMAFTEDCETDSPESVSLVDVKEKGSIMAIQRLLAITLAAVMTAGVTPSLAQQTNGIISGTADDEAKKPYSNYSVQLRDLATGQVTSSVALNALGQFSFENVGVSRQLLVELVKEKKTVCTEGPFVLTAAAPSKTNVKIDCARVPTAAWILAAGAGTAAAIGLAGDGGPDVTPTPTPTPTPFGVQSPSQ